MEAEGDATDGTLLDALHQVGGETGDLVAETLGLNNGDVVNDSLVGVEIVGEPAIKTHNRVSSQFASRADMCCSIKASQTGRLSARC